VATFRDLATDALLDLGVLAAGEVPTADDLNNALRAMNRLIDQWAAERLQIYSPSVETTWAIVSGTQTYTVGTGGTVNVARPVFLNDVRFRNTATTPPVEFQMRPLTDEEWTRIPIKTLTSTLPTSYYYNPTFPLGALKLYPVPTLSTLTGVLYAPQAVAEITNVTSTITLPPGYRRMIVKNLAVEMAPSYQREVQREIASAADQSKRVVKIANTRLSEMRFDSAALVGGSVQGSYYIRSGN
jgi:hypothetical protein